MSVGIGSGRGRGFNKMAAMADSLPKPGDNFASNYQPQSNGTPVAYDDNSWEDAPSTNNASSGWSGGHSNSGGGWSGGASNTNTWSGSGGDKTCFKCNKTGHMSRECPEGGGGDKTCFKCNKTGHMSRECPDGGGGGRSNACFKCNEEGHMSRDCPNAGSGGGRSTACFKCNEEGHMSRDCPNAGSGGGRSNACFKCNEDGHMSRDCPNGGSGGGNKPMTCYKCNEEGHMSRDCTNEAASKGRECRVCGQEGHMARDCPDKADRPPQSCFKCKETGHISRDCPNAASGDRKTGCFKCGQEGHMSRECENEEVIDPDKPKSVTYVPPELTSNVDELFASIPTGINFAKYSEIPASVTGNNAESIKAIESFEGALASRHLNQNIKRYGYTTPTPVQKWCIPIVAAKRDLMACAQTGSGKTAAFLLPIIQHMLESTDLPNLTSSQCQEPWAVVIAPTRELASQIHGEATKFTYESIVKAVVTYGGTAVINQVQRLCRGAHIVVGTPGRLLMFLERGNISFAQCKYFILDEADRLLDMGFKGDIEKMVNHPTMPQKGVRQTLMFSATFPDEVQELAREFLHDYLYLTLGVVGAANRDVSQHFFQVPMFEKKEKLVEVIQERGQERTLVFVETKRNTDFIASYLSQKNIPTTSIHGDREQCQREEALRDFKSGRTPVLMATAVAARGLDIRDVRHVINYDLPKTIDEYVHRIGRTGRVGNTGQATSFYDSDKDSALAPELLRILAMAQQEVPSWLEDAGKGGYGGGGGGNRYGSRDTRTGQSNSDNWNNNNNNNAPAEEDAWD